MNWLLWKDYRQNRLVVFVGLFILLLPYVIGILATLYQICHGYMAPQVWQMCFSGSSLYSFILSQLTIALIGGNAIAGERVDRSAEFLASLPISRRKKLASKLLLAMAIVAVIWLLNAPLLWCLANSVPITNPRDLEWFVFFMKGIAIAGLVFFCVGWCLSAFLSSPTFAVAGGLISPLLIGGCFALYDYLFGLPHDEVGVEIEQIWLSAICVTLALVSFGLGTWYYLRRVEP
jgi:ABC-type transport system involved in multi-copper enzyme maturation permease subunit